MSNTYSMVGNQAIVPQADLENLVSAANRKGDTRSGAESFGKRAGMRVWHSATSDATLKEVVALGNLSSDGWRVVDGSATVLPVNLSTWTIGSDSTYVSNVLVTDGGNDANGQVKQTVVLKAGSYRVSAFGAFHGALGVSPDYVAPRLRIAPATDTGAAVTHVFKLTGDASVAANTANKEKFVAAFTLTTASQNVVFTMDIVDETSGDATLAAGTVYLSVEPIQANN